MRYLCNNIQCFHAWCLHFICNISLMMKGYGNNFLLSRCPKALPENSNLFKIPRTWMNKIQNKINHLSYWRKREWYSWTDFPHTIGSSLPCTFLLCCATERVARSAKQNKPSGWQGRRFLHKLHFKQMHFFHSLIAHNYI